MGNGKWEMGNGKWEMGNGKWEMGNGKWEMGNGKWEMGNGKWEMGNGKWVDSTPRSSTAKTDHSMEKARWSAAWTPNFDLKYHAAAWMQVP